MAQYRAVEVKNSHLRSIKRTRTFESLV
uniref:BLTX36 n=1 Tax=Nephila pilipes TaxID=299642 RepID=A0A076KYT6_NEPPI|nr:BLTX36 [Nephila pilipes]